MSAPRHIDHEAVVAYLLANPATTAKATAKEFGCTAERIRQIARLYDVLRGWMRKEKRA